MDQSQSVQVANRRPLQITEMACSSRITPYMNFELVIIDPFAFPVMPSADDVLLMGCPTPEILAWIPTLGWRNVHDMKKLNGG